MTCLDALGAMAAEEKILAIRLRSTVIYKKDLPRLGLNIGAMDFEEEEWEIGWECDRCIGTGEICEPVWVQITLTFPDKEVKCPDCEDGLRWEDEY